ncbi:hypothetical protein GOBAR_AA26742 [Gossypium barbadense]|uniref:RNase H type-1 domain-containing protein n=1 Tax=Gossypium barbadense TaxID=3634 RepID=A0A2P5WS68_GOSBA|nr:hypothetical protein GOBAR_AA26742 [Gossypium barbadense]
MELESRARQLEDQIKLPPTGWVKINADDAMINYGSDATTAIIIRDDDGEGEYSHKTLLNCIRNLSSRDWELKIFHIYKEANYVINCLWKMSVEDDFVLQEWIQPPDNILSALLGDLLGVTTGGLCSS